MKVKLVINLKESVWLANDLKTFKTGKYLTKLEKKKLSDRINKTTKFLKINGDKIINRIAKASGCKWLRKELQICIVNKWIHDGSAFPVIIIVSKNKFKHMIYVLIHELVHNNLKGHKKFDVHEIKDILMLEVYVELITRNVIKSLFPKNKGFEETLKQPKLKKRKRWEIRFYKKSWEMIGKLEEKWDLNKKGLEYYLT
jgi:hypothetical protein